MSQAPGAPGLPPTWTSSTKDAVGTAIDGGRVWFTVGHEIVNEVCWPSVDRPQVRDLGFIVADDAGGQRPSCRGHRGVESRVGPRHETDRGIDIDCGSRR